MPWRVNRQRTPLQRNETPHKARSKEEESEERLVEPTRALHTAALTHTHTHAPFQQQH
jgi:hypothetical protein